MYADYQRLQVGLLKAEGLNANEAAVGVARARKEYPEDFRERAELLRLYGLEMVSMACQESGAEEANQAWQEWIRTDPIEVNENCLEWWTGVAAMLPTSTERADQLQVPPSS